MAPLQRCELPLQAECCGQILSPWLDVIVYSGIELFYRFDNPMQESTISPQSGTKNLATELQSHSAFYSISIITMIN
jgi:hypothetical protein